MEGKSNLLIMYFEYKKNRPFGILLIIALLVIITIILVNLINKIDEFFNINNLETTETGTDVVLNDFDIDNLIENASYSVVRSI
jgi:hypothetical protein